MVNDIIIFSPVFLPWDLALAFAQPDSLLEQSVKEILPNFMLTLLHLDLMDQSRSTEAPHAQFSSAMLGEGIGWCPAGGVCMDFTALSWVF